MTTYEINQFLRQRFSPKEWALFFEVVEGIGHTKSRCDAVAVGYAPCNWGKIIGFEIKASRSDWKNELSQPKKNEFWFNTCSEFYLVAEQYFDKSWKREGYSAGVVKIEELPEGWGLINPRLLRNNIVKKAAEKEAKLTMSLMLHLLRSASFCREKLDSIVSIAQWKNIYTIKEKTNEELRRLTEEPAVTLFTELEQEGTKEEHE